jgi:hypothetical protein
LWEHLGCGRRHEARTAYELRRRDLIPEWWSFENGETPWCAMFVPNNISRWITETQRYLDSEQARLEAEANKL